MKNIIKRTKTTLKNQNGVTVVFALVIFMVAAIISVTIVNAAMNNLSRINSQRTNEQARVAVMSAVDYLQSNDATLNAALNELAKVGVVTPTDPADPTGSTDTGETETDVEITPPTNPWQIDGGTGTSSEVEKALETTIRWTKIIKGTSMTAEVRAGSGTDGYAVTITMMYDSTDNKWAVKKIQKKE